jgi:hypothetical protein
MIDWHLVAQVMIPILSLILGAAIDRVMERRPKLVAYYGHASAFQIAPTGGNPALDVHTHAVIIRNGGRLAAHNVRVRHSYLPPNFRIYPPRVFARNPLPGGGEEIIFTELVPSEEVVVSYLYFPPLTWQQISTNISSDEGFATVLNVIPTPQVTKQWRTYTTTMQFIGVVTTLYLIVELIRFLYARLS